ncbi:DUF523 domain-containing protein [Thiohalocapsa marina]|uniref:DUF523 domain-containing protein n=1 Tax=Thiohalocapsa marina TaxID=424902 RepID=A0A5M8FQL2_9GAMM|nr:DUF523 domain-containing protein [Thiohalocapsa marina]
MIGVSRRCSHAVTHVAKCLGVKRFVGHWRSPSCSCGGTHDGTFQHRLKDQGLGVCAALLALNGLELISVRFPASSSVRTST